LKQESHKLKLAEAKVKETMFKRGKVVKKADELEFHLNEELKVLREAVRGNRTPEFDLR